MELETSRRSFLRFSAGALVSACTSPNAPARVVTPGFFPTLERSLGGRIGVFALDTASGVLAAHRADERFAMCSTFKWALVATVLARVDQGKLTLATPVAYGESDLLDYAPVTRANVRHGSLTIAELARAAITVSDNTAANLLLRRVDGPAGVTRFLRRIDDRITRLDRYEPALNANLPGDVRDTTSPRAMLSSMRRVLTGTVLAPDSTRQLNRWLGECSTGRARLRAGLPEAWKVGDKTGSGLRGAAGDVAIAWPPSRAPILIAAYLSGSAAPPAKLNRAFAEIARYVARRYTRLALLHSR